MATTETQRMLCLAALTYRGFDDPLQRVPHDGRLQRAIARGLVELAPICGDWDLVWGPATYRTPFSVFDDDMMFVARERGATDRYVIAVRGTNPISAFDWLLGDLWVSQLAPWPYGPKPRSADAKVSLSTLLGLNVLQLLQSPPPATDAASAVWKRVADDADGALDPVRALLAPIGAVAAAELRLIRDAVLPALAQLDAVRRARPRRSPVTHVLGLLDDWNSATRRHAFALLGEAVDVLAGDGSFNLLRFLEGTDRLRAALEPGVPLLRFLAAAVAAADGPVDVVVTGHSKGGALASSLALWLAETRGTLDVDPPSRWDPDGKATVRFFSYAGPTAGNAAFAARSNGTPGLECHRIANALDVVPHAWQASDVAAISTLYDGARPVPALRDLTEEIAAEIGPLRYAHVGTGEELVTLGGREEPALHDFFAQAIDQHLSAYVRALDLDRDVSLLTFFNPLA
jgi:hypothetical protein